MSKAVSEVRAGARPKVFYGWWIVGTATFFWFYGAVSFYFGFAAFVNPIVDEFGWSRAAVSFAGTLMWFGSGVGGFVAGFLTVRFKARKVILASLSLALLGFLFLSQIRSLRFLGIPVDALWLYYAAFILMALGLGAGEVLPETAVIANWFSKRRGLALALASTGAAWSGLALPGLVLLIDTVGWRTTLVILAAGMAVLILPLVSVFRWRPEEYGHRPYGSETEQGSDRKGTFGSGAPPASVAVERSFTEREALRTRTFWLLSIGLTLWSLAAGSVQFHLIAYLVSVGWERSAAGLVLSGLALGSMVGRVGFGFLADYLDKRYILIGCIALLGAGLLSLANMANPMFVVPFLLTFPLGFGGPIAVQMAVTADYFGPGRFASIRGIMSTIVVAGSAGGPVFAGAVYDLTRSYVGAFLIIAALLVVAVPLFYLARKPKHPALAAAASLGAAR
ncbi:MAG: MFS transporter [Chloroflexi bacterium]|nr:MFS transporter [Chloroflexota bacterium]